MVRELRRTANQMTQSFQDYKSVAFPADKKLIDPFLSLAYRPFSLRVSWALSKTNVSPNSITLLQIFVGLAGCLWIFLDPSISAFLGGVVLLHLAYLLDCVDGEIARAKKMNSVAGIFIDKYAHAITMPAIFVSVGSFMSFHVTHEWVATGILIVSWLANFSTFNPAARLVLTVLDALVRRNHSEQYRIENYQSQSSANQSSKGSGLAALKSAVQQNAKIGLIFKLALHSFRHVSYLAILSVFVVFVYLNVPMLFVVLLWIVLCVLLILKELVYFTMVMRTSHILDRLEEYFSKLEEHE